MYLDLPPVSANDNAQGVDGDSHRPHEGHSAVPPVVVLGSDGEGCHAFLSLSDCGHNVGAGTLGGRHKSEHNP